ncbi:metal-dependent transcriptional regulator [Corynebacterium lubricantis]|uniref:metal-dependent transcriptional regulator n=1 Tax=Corynebacterium lubricantis TaxID=541095 RepID=UPI000363F44C|nr:metal-dependent transcriptional regulator [Corynebacterium lubricantis]
MSVMELSESNQDYLKAVFGLGEWSEDPVTTSAVAARVGVRLSTASDAIKKLTDLGLLNHERYGAITLTEEGKQYAIAMVRRHRLIETFLVDVLGYGWDQVHDEAESLEHAASDFMIERLDALLEYPKRDPHGDPIPSADGIIEFPETILLNEVEPGRTVRVERVSDDDPELLQYIFDHGVQCQKTVTVQPSAPYSDTITLIADGHAEPLTLGRAAASFVRVSELNL